MAEHVLGAQFPKKKRSGFGPIYSVWPGYGLGWPGFGDDGGDAADEGAYEGMDSGDAGGGEGGE